MKITHAQITEAMAALGLGAKDRVRSIEMNNHTVVVEKFSADENGNVIYSADYPVIETHRIAVKTYHTDQAEIAKAFWKAIYELIQASGSLGDLVYDGDFITGGNQAMKERQAEEFGDVRDMIEAQIKIKAGIQ